MTNSTPHGQVPEALLLADQYAAAHAKWELEDLYGSSKSYTAEKLAERHAARAKLERALHAAHVQNPAEIEHVAGDVSKNGAEVNMSTQQPAPAGAMVDEWFLRSVIMLCNNRGASPESIENFDSGDKWIADLWRQAERALPTAPQSSPAAQAASSAVLKAIRKANMQLVRTGDDAFILVPYKVATAQAAESVPAVDQSVMELAESVGLIGPTSRIGDLHAAIQRFHDLICVNATIKAAVMAAEVISSVSSHQLNTGYPPLPMQFACSGVFPVYSADQMRAYVDADRAARAPADNVTAPAATVIKKGADRQWTSERLGHLHDGIHSLYLAPPAQAADYDHGPQSETVQEAARHVGKWLNERPNHPLDLRDVAMLCAHAQAADSVLEDAAPSVEATAKALAWLELPMHVRQTMRIRAEATLAAARKQGANHD